MPSKALTAVRGLTLAQLRDLLRFAARRLTEERLPQAAGGLTFTTVLAIVPVLTIAFAIFTTIPLFDTFRKALESYFFKNLMPPNIANSILGYLNQFAMQAKKLSAIGGVALMVTAIAMIAMVDRAFNQIWRVRRSRPLAQRMLIYWAVLTLGPLMIGISITASAYLLDATNLAVGGMGSAGGRFFTVLSLLLTAMMFTLLYQVVPNRAVDWRDALAGGIFAALAFELSKRLFVIFIAKFQTYTIVYGALAAVPIFLLWIYVGWLIVLMGAVLSAALPVVRYERWWHVALPGSAFVDAMKLLSVLVEARRGAYSAAVDVQVIRQQTRLGYDESESLLQRMLDAGWVARIKSDQPRGRRIRGRLLGRAQDILDRWTLLANPDQLRLADVYRLFVFGASDDERLTREVEAAIEHGLSRNLSDWFAGEGKPLAGLSAAGAKEPLPSPQP
ncbi:YihY family inner membrane protein [Lacisediminimonas sp.]|uniref:YihY family inner membrane protein n=1 Tax=Lacisediminimonas sp. TaxID=3060582 RepID=UPI0027180D07|nr:YihY family inner membrane protein [Lacisediminimonas sp.]MDO8301240.1 YihY family inner membrane protein [Lacisediminimonas sp.]